MTSSPAVNPCRHTTASRFLCWTLMGWYVLMALWHYLNQRPLWNDEWCILQNVQQFSAHDIFHRTLIHDQVFPRAYMWIIQQTAAPWDYHLLALRFCALVAMLIAFILWSRIAGKTLERRWMIVTFLLCWVASSKMLYYAAELKQYSMDVLAGSLYISFFLNMREWREKRPVFYALGMILLPCLGLLSYPSFLFACILLYNALVLSFRHRTARDVLMAGIPLLVIMGLSYQFDMRLRAVKTVTDGFGDYFISLASPEEFFKTWSEGTKNMFARWFAETPRWVKRAGVPFALLAIVRMVAGFWPRWRRDRLLFESLDTIGPALYLGLVALGIAHKYPFGIVRTALFFCPVVFYFMIQAIAWIETKNRRAFQMVLGIFYIYLCFIAFHLSRLIMNGDLGGIPNLLS